MSQVSFLNHNRPNTAGGYGSRLSSSSIEQFKSEIPNLPGFRSSVNFRPQTPKVITFAA